MDQADRRSSHICKFIRTISAFARVLILDDRRVFSLRFSPLSTSSPIRSSFPPPLIRQTSFSQASRLSSRVSDRTLPSSTPQRPLSTLQLHHSHSKRPSTRSGSMLSGSPVLYSASHPLQSGSSSSNGLRNTAPASMWTHGTMHAADKFATRTW